MKNNRTLRWLWTVPGGKKVYILILTLVEGLSGLTGVVFALFLRNIVDAAVARSADGFRRWMFSIILLVLGLAGEYIGRTYITVSSAPQYVIRQTTDDAQEGNKGL